MNKSTAAFIGVPFSELAPFTPVPPPGTTAYVIRQAAGLNLYILRQGSSGSFSYGAGLQDAMRFLSAHEAAQAIAKRQREFYRDVPDHFVIVPVNITTTPGKELTEEVPGEVGFALKKATRNDADKYVEWTMFGTAAYTPDLSSAQVFTAEEAGQFLAKRASDPIHEEFFGSAFALVPVTTPATTKVVGREPSTVTVELA